MKLIYLFPVWKDMTRIRHVCVCRNARVYRLLFVITIWKSSIMLYDISLQTLKYMAIVVSMIVGACVRACVRVFVYI